MKNTVYTVIAVLLMATLCLPATAQEWVLEDSWAGPADDNTYVIFDIEFRDNHQVFYGRWDRLYKWDFDANQAHWLDFGGTTVQEVEVPRDFGSAVIYAVGSRIEIRRTSNLSYITGANVEGTVVDDLDVDNTAEYIAGMSVNNGTPDRWWTFDIWGPNGWQLERHDFNESNHVLAAAIHPTSDSPTRYFVFGSEVDVIRERYGRTSWGDRFTTTTPIDDDIKAIAVGRFQGSTRVAGIVTSGRIHLWDWWGNHLSRFRLHSTYFVSDSLQFTPNGHLLAILVGRNVIFWDLAPWGQDSSSFAPANIPLNTSLDALAISDNGKLMAIGCSNGTVYIYRWTGGSAPVAPPKEAEPAQPTALLENYPNPFNPETWIPYQLSETAEVTVTIHASDGKLVRTLELGQVPAGVYSEKDRAAYWDGQNEQGEPVASGVYFYTLTAGEFSATRKMVIRK